MKNKKVLYILLFLIILITVIYLYINNSNKVCDNIDCNHKIDESILKKVDNVEDYYILKACIDKYYINMYEYFMEESSYDDRKVNLNNIYFLLDKNYTEKYDINIENLKDYIYKINKVQINIDKCLYYMQNKNIRVYFVYGTLFDTSNKTYNDFKNIIIQDLNTKSYSIYLDNYLEDMNYLNLNEGKKVNFLNYNEISRNNYNMYGEYNATYDMLVNDIYNKIRNYLLYNTNKAYKLIDSSYKEEKFTSYDEFLEYVNEKSYDIYSLILKDYKIQYENEMAIYKCYCENNDIIIEICINNPIDYTYKIYN